MNLKSIMAVMAVSREMLESFFDNFQERLARLQQLRKQFFVDEAFTLCLVYIDRLASGHFGGTAGQNRKNFWKALTHLSGNPLFGMIHPRNLRELSKLHFPPALSFIQSVVNIQANVLLNEDALAAKIRKSSLPDPEKAGLISNLWRASIANITYDCVRVAGCPTFRAFRKVGFHCTIPVGALRGRIVISYAQ